MDEQKQVCLVYGKALVEEIKKVIKRYSSDEDLEYRIKNKKSIQVVLPLQDFITLSREPVFDEPLICLGTFLGDEYPDMKFISPDMIYQTILKVDDSEYNIYLLPCQAMKLNDTPIIIPLFI